MDGNIEMQRVNRLFATTSEEGVELHKYRMFKDKPQYTKFMNAPSRAHVVNGNMKDMKTVGQMDKFIELDYDYYIGLAEKRLIKFIGKKKWKELYE